MNIFHCSTAPVSGNAYVPANLFRFTARVQRRMSKNPKIAELQAASSEGHSVVLEITQLLQELWVSCSLHVLTDNESPFKKTQIPIIPIWRRRDICLTSGPREKHIIRVSPRILPIDFCGFREHKISQTTSLNSIKLLALLSTDLIVLEMEY